MKTFAADSMKPNKLKRPLKTVHEEIVAKYVNISIHNCMTVIIKSKYSLK
jgi:hypothetical protein